MPRAVLDTWYPGQIDPAEIIEAKIEETRS
jgi:hypothetical protein